METVKHPAVLVLVLPLENKVRLHLVIAQVHNAHHRINQELSQEGILDRVASILLITISQICS